MEPGTYGKRAAPLCMIREDILLAVHCMAKRKIPVMLLVVWTLLSDSRVNDVRQALGSSGSDHHANYVQHRYTTVLITCLVVMVHQALSRP